MPTNDSTTPHPPQHESAPPSPERYVCKYCPPAAEATIRKLFTTLEAGGWRAISVYDGEEYVRAGNVEKALDVIDSVEESMVTFTKNGRRHGVSLIPGNGGEDCICDYSFSEGDPDGFDALMNSI